MTLLTALNRAQRRLSLTVTSTIIADGQETQNLLWELANVTAEDLLAHDWPLLKRTQSFTASLASLQASGKPSDFHHAMKGTFWNASQDRQIAGPLNDEEWAAANGANLISQIEQYVMFRYDGLHVFPTPTVADTITFDYVINTPIQATGGGAYKTAFTADTDVFLLGDRLLLLGVRWRYLADKGRDYAEAMRDSEWAISEEMENQRGAARVLGLSPPDYDDVPEGHVPEAGFGA